MLVQTQGRSLYKVMVKIITVFPGP